MTQILIDTNVLVYVFEQNDWKRQDQAALIIRFLEKTSQGRLTVQNLAEFFNVTTRKLHPPLTPSQAMIHIQGWMQVFPVLPLTDTIVLEAARGVRDHHLAYYDAQIWASARLNQIPVIFSEDFQDGQILEGIRFVNPFSPSFNLETWG